MRMHVDDREIVADAKISSNFGITKEGEVWELALVNNQSAYWNFHHPAERLPIPVDEIAFYGHSYFGTPVLVSKSGEGWFDQGNAGWVSGGVVPQ